MLFILFDVVLIICLLLFVYKFHDLRLPLHCKSWLFWDVTQRRLVDSYCCFRVTYHFHLQGSSSPRTPLKFGPIGCPKMSVTNYQTDRLSHNVGN